MADKAAVRLEDVPVLAARFGLRSLSFVQLNGYDDLNFWIKDFELTEDKFQGTFNKDGYVLKIINSTDSKDIPYIEGQTELLLHLGSKGFKAPQPVRDIHGKYYFLAKFEGREATHVVRLLTFIPGKLIKDIYISNEIALNMGTFLYKLDTSMMEINNSALKTHYSKWKLQNAPNIRECFHVVKENNKKEMIETILRDFEEKVLVDVDILEKGIIHGDFNEQNILYNIAENEFGILDFGDSHYAPYIFEVAIGLCYLLGITGRLEMAKYFLSGYAHERSFSNSDLLKIEICMKARLCQSLVLGLYSYTQDPGNKYILSTQEAGWKLLSKLNDLHGLLL